MIIVANVLIQDNKDGTVRLSFRNGIAETTLAAASIKMLCDELRKIQPSPQQDLFGPLS